MSEMLGLHIEQVIKEIEGKVISVEGLIDKLNFIKESKRLARTHDWLYHCTNDAALLSILKNRELWLSNLKLVNDREEVERVDVPEYDNTYYVGCFTYDTEIPDEHWKEYGNLENGILIGVKPEWVRREAVFLCGNNTKCDSKMERIFANEEAALESKIEQQQTGCVVNPFFINSFGFYQVVYDDELVKKIAGNSLLKVDNGEFWGRSIIPEIAGIIKSKTGTCTRWGKEPYIKDWTTEKEVRLKMGIQQYDIFQNGHEMHDGMIMNNVFYPKIAVPVTENAFGQIRIKFSPKFVNKDNFVEKIKKMMPESMIEILD